MVLSVRGGTRASARGWLFAVVACLLVGSASGVSWEANATYLSGIDLCTHDNPYRAPLCAQTLLYTTCALISLGFLVRKLYLLLTGISIEKYHVAIVGLGLVECTLLAIHYSVAHHMELHFVALYLLINQFLVACVFYGGLAIKLLKRRVLLAWVCYPLAVLIWGYFTFALILACQNIDSRHRECQRIEWIMFSSSHFALAQVCLLAAIVLYRAMGSVRADPAYISQKKRMLCILVGVFELSAVGNFFYDIALLYGSTDCNIPALGSPNTAAYMITIWGQTLATFFVPQWVFLAIIKPAMRKSDIVGVEMPPTHGQSPTRVSFPDDDEPKIDTPLLR